MIDWPIKQTICGIAELPSHCAAGITHILSILDPGLPDDGHFDSYPAGERLVLRFHDLIEPAPFMTAPTESHINDMLAFGRQLPDGSHLLVHCHMGVSRSTAAAAALLLQARPETDEDALFGRIAAVRPQAWPNSRIIALADERLQRGGRLLSALGRHYRRQLERNPGWAEAMREGGRGAEIDLAESVAN